MDGNKTLILGLLWTIILRFQIQDIEIELEDETDRKVHSSKEALLLWCQRKTHGYPNVRIADFTQSWRNGMAFNALIHSQRPDLINYGALNPNAHLENLNSAFEIAQRHLAIQPLLDAEDVDVPKPDERSILTYVSSFYHTFAKYNSEIISGKRITNIISQLMEIDRCQLNYELFTTNLLNWIQMKIFALNSRDFPNSLEGIHQETIQFKEYRTVEKPPKYKERSEIEAMLFSVQTKMKALGQAPYSPPEGKLVQDISRAWINLEKAEHKRELALREEAIRLEKLNNLAQSFHRKSEIRKGYLSDMIAVLSDPRYGVNLSQVEATVKKHEAICVDITSRGERIEALSAMVAELAAGNYHGLEAVRRIEAEIKAMWERMLALLQAHQSSLAAASAFMASIKEIGTVESELRELKGRLGLDAHLKAVGHLRAVEQCLQTQALMEAQIASHGDTVKRLTATATRLMGGEGGKAKTPASNNQLIEKELPMLRSGIDSLKRTYAELKELAAAKREQLTKLRNFYQLLQDVEEEDAALSEKQNICQAILPGKDLLGMLSLQQKHNAFEAEARAHESRVRQIEKRCRAFIDGAEGGGGDHSEKVLVEEKLTALLAKWTQLLEATRQKSKELADAMEAFQYHADANEAESWLRERMQLARSEDYGDSEQSAASLLQRHSRLENEVTAYSHDIERLNAQSERMIASGVENLFLLCEDPFLASAYLTGETNIDEDIAEEAAVPTVVYEEIEIPQVQVLYNYKGNNDYSVKKGEVLLLLDQTTPEWWSVRREADPPALKGFVPANYVKVVAPKRSRIARQKKPTAEETAAEKAKSLAKKKAYNRRHSKRRLSIVSSGTETVKQRKERINGEYRDLVEACQNRRESLEESAKLFRFNRECDTLEEWIVAFEGALREANGVYHDEKKRKQQDGSQQSASQQMSAQFEKFITDLLANRSRLEEIDKLAAEVRLPAYLPTVRRRQEALHKKWDNLTFLQKQLGKNIEGLSTVEVFNAACDEAAERIADKLEKINNAQDMLVLGHDLKTVQALQRRHENIERELVPIEDSLKRIMMLSENVSSSYPLQREHVQGRLRELNRLWEELKACSVQKRALLDKMIGLQILKNSAAEVQAWMTGYVRPLLAYDPTTAAVSPKELLLNLDSVSKEHHDLLQEMDGKANDVKDLQTLSAKLARQIPAEEVAAVERLAEDYQALYKDWAEKEAFLKQCRDLVVFNQEADHLETIINSHLAFLDLDNLGSNVHDVASLAKQHDTFMATLNAQDQRVHNFDDFGEKLAQSGHFDKANIEQRRRHVSKRRKDLKERAFNRGKLLREAKIYQEIKADADEFLGWCAAKAKLLVDDEGEELVKKGPVNAKSNMERKLKRHQAVEAEVRANKSLLDRITRTIAEVNKSGETGYASSELAAIGDQVQQQWEKLVAAVENRGRLFEQAAIQIEHAKSLEVVQERVSELTKAVIHSEDYGSSRRSCRELMAQCKAAENELNLLTGRLSSLDDRGQRIAEDGHFNSEAILGSGEQLTETIAALKKPLAERRRRLEEANQYYQFEFDVNGELQWIREHLALATSADVPQNLTEAQNAIKKFEQNFVREVEGHESCIRRVIASGEQLMSAKKENEEEGGDQTDGKQQQQQHLQAPLSRAGDIGEKTAELEAAWAQLQEETGRRHQALKAALSVQQFLAECAEIEQWTAEKLNVLHGAIFGNDEITVVKLLQKQKTADLEIDTYSGLAEELARQVEKLVAENEGQPMISEADQKLYRSRVHDLQVEMKRLKKQNHERSMALIELKKLHEFHRESTDFLAWVAAQKQALLNEDYGRDHEHCVLLQAKFFDLKRAILSSEERYNACGEFAASLSKSDDDSREVGKRMDEVTDAWNELVKILNIKEQNFLAAVKIHRFNRDVADAFERIKEKGTALAEADLGRDTHSVQALIRRHDLFENDLVVLEAQLQVMINDSVKLQAAYPGGNAKNISEQLTIVVEHWEGLKEKSRRRREGLFDAELYYRFLAAVRRLEQWALNLLSELKTLETVRDIQSSQALKVAHERLKAEIDGREEEFSAVVAEANSLTSKTFYPEVKGHTERLLATRGQLHTAWQVKNVYLDQLIDLNCFLRDVKQLDHLCQQAQNRLTSAHDFGQTVEEVDAGLRKFDDFIRVFESQEGKFRSVEECGGRLVAKQHFDAETIQIRLGELLARRQKLAALITERREELADALIAVQFKRDVLETEGWIDEKQAAMEKERHFAATSPDQQNIEAKMKKLQKHQTFEAEINANASRITEIQSKAGHLIKKNHPSSIEIRSQRDTLLKKWDRLVGLSRETLQGFEEAKDIYEFNRDIGAIEAWIREKRAMLQFNETGEDFEHCQSLLRKLDDVGTDMKVDENRILHLNNLANKLIHQCSANEFFSEETVNGQRNSLNENWAQLQARIAEYRSRLVVALEVHSLNRDLDDLAQRVAEKALAVAKEADGKDLAAVENHRRKHEAVMVEMAAIEYQFKAVTENEARRLINKYPDLTEGSRAKIAAISESLRQATQDCKAKEAELAAAVNLHRFFDLVREIEHWAEELLAKRLAHSSNAVSVAEAKADLQNHEYVKAELAGRRESHQSVRDYGLQLVQQIEQQQQHQAKASAAAAEKPLTTASEAKTKQIEACVERLDDLRKRLDLAWEEKHHYLKQCLELRLFYDLGKQVDSWLASKEAFLANEDLGGNLLAVEDLLRKHDTFVKSLAAAQQGRLTELVAAAEGLLKRAHFDSEAIQSRLTETQARWERLQASAEQRRRQLEDSKVYYAFLRNVNEMLRWLGEKLKVAGDESYRDSINLLSKIQRHAAFEAEISANRERVDAVVREGEALIGLNHFKAEDIKGQLSTMEKLLRSLTEAASLKRVRLNEAYQSLQFFRLCDDLDLWIKDTEGVIRDEDCGRDLTSVKNLLKKHQLVENDVHNHNENIEQVKDHLLNFTQSKHFLREEIEERAGQIIRAYNSIHEPMTKRRELLEEALTFFQFKRDLEDELQWIREREQAMAQYDSGATLADTQRLLKRLKMFESELQTREPHLSALVSKGHNMIKSSNNNSEEIRRLTYELQQRIQQLKDDCSLRRLRLVDSLEAQQFYADLAEAESWLSERLPALQSEETLGSDEESVAGLMKRLEVVNKDTDRFYSTTMSRLVAQAAAFREKGHFEGALIEERMDALNAHFNRFVELAEARRQLYLRRRQYFAFERDADELALWAKDQLIVANSEDYGTVRVGLFVFESLITNFWFLEQDVEHVEKLIQQFDTFAANVNANEERFTALEAEAKKGVEGCEEKLAQVAALWAELREATAARQEALQGAKKVHTFYQSADETICWIREKESSTVLDEVNVNLDDLSTIQAKIRQLEGFDRDLDAVKEQVEALFVEADRLAALFPDISENIEERKNNVRAVWSGLSAGSVRHRENLLQIEAIQSYFDEFRLLLTWIKEMMALITAEERLGGDPVAAEEQLHRHREYKAEIDSRADLFTAFLASGEHIIAGGHFMAADIGERNGRVRTLHANLLDTWRRRLTLYEYNLDARQFIQDSEQVEKWIDEHLPLITDDGQGLGESLAEVETLLQKHDEFEKTIESQADKLKAIERVTLIEGYFEELKAAEEANRVAEANLREKERMAALVAEEQRKILHQRKNEEDAARLYENTAQFAQQSPGKQASKEGSSKISGRRSSFNFSRKPVKIRPEVENLPVACEGFLERKQIFSAGGKKATSRSWKTYYTVLCGQLLCFFKDKNAFYGNSAASPPFSIHDARCLEVADYRKRKHVFSIQLTDMTKFYFAASDAGKLRDWHNKISYRALLPPSKQLLNVGDLQAAAAASEMTGDDGLNKSSPEKGGHADALDGSTGSSSSRKSSLSSPSHHHHHQQQHHHHHHNHPHSSTATHSQSSLTGSSSGGKAATLERPSYSNGHHQNHYQNHSADQLDQHGQQQQQHRMSAPAEQTYANGANNSVEHIPEPGQTEMGLYDCEYLSEECSLSS